MRQILTARVLDSPYTRHVVDLKELTQLGWHLQFTNLCMGTGSATDMLNQDKYIDQPYAPVSDWELARAYLDDIWKESDTPRKRVGWNKKTFKFLDLVPPQFFGGQVRGEDQTYVDISSAYFQLYTPLTLDTKFSIDPLAFGLGHVPFANLDWLKGEKRIRNVTVGGIARSRRLVAWRGGKRIETNNRNKYLAPELWGYIALTLHSIAGEVQRYFNPSYINNDGYIVPTHEAELLREYLADRWELFTTIKGSGVGSVYGMGSYEIGEARSKYRHAGTPFDSVRPYDSFLADKLAQFRLWALQHSRPV